MSKAILKRIFHNKTAIITSASLVFLFLLSVCAFIIIPDNTIDSNRQIPQLALSTPGSSQKIIIIQNSETSKADFTNLWKGRRDLDEYIPYDRIIEGSDNIEIWYKGTMRNIVSQKYKRSRVFYLFGSDKFGRDVLSRIILGLRISLTIGLLAVLVSLTIGIVIGSLGGFYGGKIDALVMLIINTSWSIPTLLLAFAIILAFGKGLMVIFLAVGLTMWVDVARLVRGQVMQEKSKNYVIASQVLGLRDMTTLFKHILPNIIGPILVMAAANFATAILVEAGLSYLGFGIQPPTPSLGNMLKENYAYATGGFVYLAFFPILAIMVLVLCFNLLGTALRDVFDTKSNLNE